jgi:hypothetical protein
MYHFCICLNVIRLNLWITILMKDYDLNEFCQIRWFWIDEIPFEKSDLHMKRFLQKMSHQKQLKVGRLIEANK